MTSGTIGSRVRSGLAWKAASQVTLQISRMLVALVMARLLAPHEWGLAAMVIVFSGLVTVFTDNALGTALVQRRQISEDDRSTVFWVNAGVGLLLTLAGVALARPVAAMYGEPDVAPLFAVFSVTFLVRSLGTTQAALFTREMRFRNLELPVMFASIAGAAAGLTIAFAGLGAWAIIGQQIAEAVTVTALLWYLSAWRPSFRFANASLRRLGAFAGNVFGENLVSQANATASSLLIGRFLGAASLGTYVLALNVILMPFSRIAAPLQQVFFPAFAQVSDDRERLTDMWTRAARLIALISMPALVGLIVVAPDFVQVVLGSHWSEATPVIRILACGGIIVSVQTLNGEVLLALNRAGTLFRLTIFAVCLNLCAVGLGVRWGIIGVAACGLAATLVIEPLRAFITTRALGISLWRFVLTFSGVAQATAAMGATVLLARLVLIAWGAPTAVRLGLLVVIGGVTYAGLCVWRVPELMTEIRRAIGLRRRRAVASPTPLEAGH